MIAKFTRPFNSLFTSLVAAMLLISCAQKDPSVLGTANINHLTTQINTDTATFGAGCFWCVEAMFQQLKGVLKVTSGYSGGRTPNPTYEQICSKKTGHAEVCQIVYDPAVIRFDQLLEAFWKMHDPTTLDQQGNDCGPQYRSVIFYHNQQQKKLSEEYRKKLNNSGVWSNPIVTAIEPLKNFYEAESYQQNYYNTNGNQMYCRYIIQPKLAKFEQVFSDKLK